MKTPESYEKDDICKFLDSLDSCWYFKPYMAGYGKSGVSDIVGCLYGIFFAIEVKCEGKEPTPLQWRRMGEVQVALGLAFWGTAAKVIPEFKKAFNLA